jgi:hypothetical protein
LDEVQAFQAALSQQMLFHYLKLDENGHFVNAPSTDDELDEFIWLAYGIRFPRKVITPGHKTSFQFISDLFFERVKNALGFASRNGGKCLSLDTWVLCEDGFRTVADLQVGMRVFAPDGTLTRILSKSQVHTDHACFDVRIDRDTFVADADHLWEVRLSHTGTYRTMDTLHLAAFVWHRRATNVQTQARIRKTKPLVLPEQDLPVDPYVLGAYLGDGCRHDSGITSEDPKIVEEIRKCGWEVVPRASKDRAQGYCVRGLRPTLRRYFEECPAPGMPKSVPSRYLLSSPSQRLALLQGLMDTDGHAAASRNRCEFDTTDRDLADAVRFLVASLGGNPAYYERGPGKLNGELFKDRYRVVFRPEPGWNPFRLRRKADRVRAAAYCTDHRVLSIELRETVPVQCIQVDHPSHLFLAGTSLVPTHNTYGVAVLNHLDMIFKPGCEIASAGAVKDQADKCYRYFREFNEMPWFTRVNEQHLVMTGKPMLVNSIKSHTEFGNGSLLEVITGSEKGFRGPHPNKARVDEIDELDWDIFQTGLSMAQSSKGIRGQNVFTSTRQHSDGSMQRLLDEAHEKGIEIYEWNVWEMLERCPRRCFDDREHGNCPIFTFCKGQAHNCAGFYKVDDFVDKVRLIDRDKFETEWLNSKPARHKLVYPQFSPSRHVLSRKQFAQMFGREEPSWEWPMVSSIDFGSSPGHPFVYGKLVRAPVSGAWILWEEYVKEQALLREHAKAIQGTQFYRFGEWCYSDWDAQDRLELQSHGIHTRPAVKSVSPGLDYVKSLLMGTPPQEIPMLYVMEWCTNAIYEFNKYQWPTRPDGKPDKSGRPMQENDHSMDQIRYGLYSYHKQGGVRYRGRQRRW